MVNKDDLSKIGIGTWGIGGFAERDPKNDDRKQIEALKYTFNNGVNLIEATYWYAEGKAVELIKLALDESSKKRDQIFITSTIYPYRNPTLKEAEKEMEILLNTLKTDYIDTVQFLLSSLPQWGRDESKQILKKWLSENIVRYVSVTNFDLESLREFKEEFGEKLFSHEVILNFEIRENQDLGIIDFAKENDIKNFIFQPLRRNRTVLRNWPLLMELSEKYSKTQNQIILNWLIWKGCIPLTKSENIEHIDESIGSIGFVMSQEDYLKIDEFRPKGWKAPKIDWYKTGDGQPIFMLPNIFDEEYNKQNSI
jgi:diketogulonate reductase-like aldo/keto reductase